MTGPSLVNFTGFLAVHPLDESNLFPTENGKIVASPGTTLRLAISVLQEGRAGTAGPERAADGEPLFILEPVNIEGGISSAPVPFDVVIDSATLSPIPHKQSIQVLRDAQFTLALQVPADESNEHEAWLQLYQAGRLIQAVVLLVDARPGGIT